MPSTSAQTRHMQPIAAAPNPFTLQDFSGRLYNPRGGSSYTSVQWQIWLTVVPRDPTVQGPAAGLVQLPPIRAPPPIQFPPTFSIDLRERNLWLKSWRDGKFLAGHWGIYN
ncbi:Hypothetical protein D9617_15g043070 [Elsinoe fawcettii]|nr:Hypothetical protein D9617_15g043070 [Elsinoe fawcettii]